MPRDDSYDILNLKELASEFEDLQEAKERIDSGESTEDEEVDFDRERFDDIESFMHNADITDLSLASKDGLIFVKDEDFESYVKDTAVETGTISRDHALFNYIDWESYANDEQTNWTEVSLGSDTYYYQAN